jgi:CBS-domain-containing membrane protein
VRDVMTRDVVSVGPDSPYRKVVDALVGRNVSAAPVVDGDRRVVGVVSEADLVGKGGALGVAQQRRVFVRRSRGPRVDDQQPAVAADLITAPAITVGAQHTGGRRGEAAGGGAGQTATGS